MSNPPHRIVKEWLQHVQAEAARICDTTPGRVQIQFAYWGKGSDGPDDDGYSYSIDVTRKSGDKRRNDERYHGNGDDLSEALVDLARRYENTKDVR